MSSVKSGRWAACVAASVAFGLTWGGAAHAQSFRIAPGDSVIGSPFYVKTRHKDTLLDFARQNNMGYEDMDKANPRVDMWVPGEGSEALIPSFWVLPNVSRNGIVMNRAEKRIYYFPPEDANRVDTFAVSIGKEGWDTPLGTYSIIEKKENPTWTPPESIRKAHAEYGDILPPVVPAGPDNPLGLFAMRLSNPSYLIHGTNKPWGLGMEVSSGCIRMYPEGIEELFGKVENGTSVTIVDQPYKLGWLGRRPLSRGARGQGGEAEGAAVGDPGVCRGGGRSDDRLAGGGAGPGGEHRPPTARGKPAQLSREASLGHDLLIHAVQTLGVGVAASLGALGGVQGLLGHVTSGLVGGAAAEQGGAEQGRGGQGSELDDLGHWKSP